MSCCGKGREALRAESGGAADGWRRPAPVNGRVVFEYTGPGTTVVRGAATGRGYAFGGYGARVVVDARDAASLGRLPHLQRVLR
jgi:hypothetical protein